MNDAKTPGEWNPRSRCGAKSIEALISVNVKYGRLYFSAFAVRRLQLHDASVIVEQRNDGWVLLVNRKQPLWKLTQYQGAYYLVHRAMVDDIVRTFSTETIAFQIEASEDKAIEYKLTPLLDRPTKKRRHNKITTNNARRKSELNSAFKLLSKYEHSDFDGRIKTQEVAKAEILIRNTRR